MSSLDAAEAAGKSLSVWGQIYATTSEPCPGGWKGEVSALGRGTATPCAPAGGCRWALQTLGGRAGPSPLWVALPGRSGPSQQGRKRAAALGKGRWQQHWHRLRAPPIAECGESNASVTSSSLRWAWE